MRTIPIAAGGVIDDRKDSDRGADLLLWLALALSIGVGLFLLWALPGVRQVQTIPYSQFLDPMDHGKVAQSQWAKPP